MKELHDLTGSFAVTLLVCLVILGMAVFQFAAIKDIVKLKRPLLVRVHSYITPVLLVVLLVHFFTTDKRPLTLVAGLILLAMTALTGFALRMKKLRAHSFKPMVYMKIFLVCAALALTAYGHNALDEHKQDSIYMQGTQD